MARYEFTIPQLKGYTWDSVEKAVYSTKRPGEPRALTWAQSHPWATRRVAMITTSGVKVSYTEAELMNMIKGNPVDSVIHQDTVKTPAEPTANTYIVVVIEDGRLKPSTAPKRHCSLLEAQKEAERLATTNPGLRFCVLKDCGTVQASGVQWS